MPSDESEPLLTADDTTTGTASKAAPEAAEADGDTEPGLASRLANRTAGRFADGSRHTWAGLRHWLTGGYQSDEEVRRRLVLRQLTAYEAVRERARDELDEVRAQITKKENRGASGGWTDEEREEVKDLRADRKRRETAYKDLVKRPFVPVQPTREQIRRARYGSSTRRSVLLVVLGGAAVYVLALGPTLLLVVLCGAVCGLFWAGGRPPALTQRPVPADLLARPELAPDAGVSDAEADPEAEDVGDTDLRGVVNSGQATDHMRRALVQEGAKVQEVHGATRTAWGWQTTTVLRSGTAADIVRILPKLDRAFRVGDGRTMAAGNPDDAAEVRLRVLISDPFADPPAYPVRAPWSCSILEPFSPCISLEGDPTDIVLAGLHALIVAVTGGGKSSLVRSLAEYATACRDAVAWSIDPTGKGLGPLRHAAGRTAHTPKDAEEALETLLAWAQARISLLSDEDDNWVITSGAPAIIGFVDEWPQLTKRAKKAALRLLQIGRKARITLVICTQDATADIMGDAVADSFGIRVLLPCRMADVPLVVGKHTAVAEGWLPHILTPGDETDPGDAGRCYLVAPRHKEPILRYVVPLDPHVALALAKERQAAGLPTIDAATTGAEQDTAPPFVRLLLDAFDAAEAADDDNPPEHLTVAQIVDHLAANDDRYDQWRKWDGRKDRLAMVGRAIQSELKRAGVDVATVRAPGAGRATAYRLEDLRAAAGQPA
jgi:hypothetical protein